MSAVSAAILTTLVVPASTAGATGQQALDSTGVDSRTAESFQQMAEDVLDERTEALLDRERPRSADRQRHRNIRVASALARHEKGGRSKLRGRKARLAALGEAYADSDTRVDVDKVRVRGRHATVQVTETTTLTYKKVRGDEPSTTGFQAHHELRFTERGRGEWELTRIRPTDTGLVAVNQPDTTAQSAPGALPASKPAATTWPAPSAPKDWNATGYDYRAMARYAERYWYNYNPEYRRFNDAGGDCTNFVSQALKAGGWQHVPGGYDDHRAWWYGDSYQSTSWVGANEWSWFTLSQKRATNLASAYQLDVGDVMQMDFDRDGSKDHTMITTYRSFSGVPYLTYHSVNTYRKSLASIVASYPNAVYYAYRT
ncbi:amidase domain-containing protein [Streptomyces sp. MUM 203J]|uniref:amidase domain-containing protein n=1 Tax=Streptomyces sp. MUM 203J TaxID=2791990 RepID=UPI001F04AF03|nr:amidase domain-containing protein [Streptomyces sp. MUM 203J]